MAWLENIFASHSSLAWGRECELCKRPMDRDGYICWECFSRLPLVDQSSVCGLCPRELAGTYERVLCGDCSSVNIPYFDGAASACHFEGEIRQLILDYKYNGRIYLAKDLAAMMYSAASIRFDISRIDAVIPVCSSLWHRLLRGYNQCDYLAMFLAKMIGVPCMPRALRRKGFPRRQAGLNAAERRKNAKNSFRCRGGKYGDVKGKTVLVVDDVYTTGATLSACALALKKAGAKRVYCITIAVA